MHISFEKLGQARNGTIGLHDLTIICGANNSGKTYISYAMYGVLKWFPSLFHFPLPPRFLNQLTSAGTASVNVAEVRAKFAQYIDSAGLSFTQELDRFFNAPDGFFSEAKVRISLDKEEIGPPANYKMSAKLGGSSFLEAELDAKSENLTFLVTKGDDFPIARSPIIRIIHEAILQACIKQPMPIPFVVTSERTGVSLFYKDLDYNSNAIISHLRDSEKIDPIKILEAMRSRYALPIQDNIDTVREYENLAKRKSYLRADKDRFRPVFDAMSDLLMGGSFRTQSGQLTYSMRKTRNERKVEVPLYIASSAVKSLFLVDAYINNIAQEGQILIIDEPELNLHPDNQVKVARLVARLVNSGTKVLLTTHSDYIVREINNLISLNHSGSSMSSLKRKFGIEDMDVLQAEQVGAYVASGSAGLQRLEVDSAGIDTSIFDAIISAENRKAQEIYLSEGDESA